MKTLSLYISARFAQMLAIQTMIILFCCNLLAQVGVDVPAVTNSELFKFIFENFGNFKGASTLVIINLAAQILMKFGGTPLFDGLKLDPKYKFLAFGILHFAISITGLMIGTQMSLMEALTSSGIMLPLVNYLYNVYEYFFEKDKPKTVSALKR